MAKVADRRASVCGRYKRGLSVIERFWLKVEFTETDCWMWTASLKPRTGYAAFYVDGSTPNAHRWAYQQFIGPVPEGLHLDHLCRNRACVNPWHLEPVTPAINAARGERPALTHCPQGHPYAGDNLYVWRNHRRCRTCAAEALRRHRERKAEAVAAAA